MDKNRTEYWCKLWFDTGDDSPHQISDHFDVSPSIIEIKGESSHRGRLNKNEKNLWIYESQHRYADSEYEIYKCVEDVLQILNRNHSNSTRLINQYKQCGLIVCCDTYTYWVQHVLPHSIIVQLEKYNLPLEFSIMTYNDEE